MDVLIPFHWKDSDTLRSALPFIRKNILNVRVIYIVGEQDPEIPDTVFVSESVFPYKALIPLYYPRYLYRTGWIFQQLIKMMAWKFIEGLSPIYLVWDSDTVPYRPLKFVQDGVFLFGKSHDIHDPYFEHIHRVYPDLTNTMAKDTCGLPTFSAISHHQILSRSHIEDLIQRVEAVHDNMPFELVFLSSLDPNEKAPCSEYELYGNFMRVFYPDIVRFRDLKMIQTSTHHFGHTFDIDYPFGDHMDLVSYHKYENQDI